MKTKALILFVLLSLGILTGCVALQIDQASREFNKVQDQVSLGDFKDKVLAILNPTQENVPLNSRKKADKYIKESVLIEIYYMRTSRQSDGITTDDEFTPYIFNDGKLVGIGWALMGGPKSYGQAKDTYINNTTTNTVVY